MIGGIVTLILLLALGYLIFVYSGKQVGLNKTLGFVVVGVIVVTLIAIPVFSCARHFMGKSGSSQECGMKSGKGGLGLQGCNPEMQSKFRGKGNQQCPMQGNQGNFQFGMKSFPANPNFKGEEDIITNRVPGKDDYNSEKFYSRVPPFGGLSGPAGILNGAAEMIQKDPKLADEFVKALKDKPEALKALKEKLK